MASSDISLGQIIINMEDLFKNNTNDGKKGKIDKAKLQDLLTSLEKELDGKIEKKHFEKVLEKDGDALPFRAYARCVCDLATTYHKACKGGKKAGGEDDDDNDGES